MTETGKVDILNFVLIWFTLAISYYIPFELFLFSYAVLGPLHYLTEINWLEKKNYFLKNTSDKKNYLIAVIVLLGLTTVTFFMKELGKWDITKSFQQDIYDSAASKPISLIMKWSYLGLYAGLLISVVYLVADKLKNRLLIAGIIIIMTLFFFRYPFFTIWFGTFLPTIIHVFIFTILFMWSGAKRSKSGWGYLNIISMVFVLLIIVSKSIPIHPKNINYDAINTLIVSNFHQINFTINKILGATKNDEWDVLSPNVWKAQVFIAFAYTYHYLNWFSKTTVINWHKVNKRKMIITVILWVVSVVLFYINYRIGFAALFVLSMLHVILEFPLNVNSIMFVFQPRKK